MRRWLNIKVYILGLAWLVIFLHDTIPHFHISQNGSGCNDLVHSSDKQTKPESSDRSYNSDHNHGTDRVCHFSANLFTKHSLDNAIALIGDTDFLSFSIAQTDTIVTIDNKGHAPPLRLGNSLRAPPNLS